MFKQRMDNITFGRAMACILTSFILTVIFRIIVMIFHMESTIPQWTSRWIYAGLLIWRLWHVSKTAPPKREQPFGHM